MHADRTHTIPVSLTSEESRVIHDLAALRNITTSDLVREALGLPPLQEALHTPTPPAASSLADRRAAQRRRAITATR
jgi:hypothetical protein